MKKESWIKAWAPPIIYKNAIRIKDQIVGNRSPFRELVKGNSQFRNRHSGQRVFILASGPSIRTQDLKFLKEETCIAVSHFHLHEDIKVINPKYHLLAPQHEPFTFEDSSKYFVDFKNAYAKTDTEIFLGVNKYPYNYFELLKAHPELSVKNLHYIDYSSNIQIDEENCHIESNWDISKRPFVMRTVIYGAIQLALYMGFSEIYLVGCDHDYLNDITRTTNHHFYQEEKGISDQEHLEAFSKEDWFLEYFMRWKHYRLMKEHLALKNVRILNATKGGLLDVFERVELDDFSKVHR